MAWHHAAGCRGVGLLLREICLINGASSLPALALDPQVCPNPSANVAALLGGWLAA